LIVLKWQAEAARSTEAEEEALIADGVEGEGGNGGDSQVEAAAVVEEVVAPEAITGEAIVNPAEALSDASKEAKPKGRPKGSGNKGKLPAPPKENTTSKVIPSKAAFHEVHEKVLCYPRFIVALIFLASLLTHL